MAQSEDSFLRWQEKRSQQLGFVNQLLIGLATGMLAFQVQLAFGGKSFTAVEKRLLIPSIFAEFLSLGLGCQIAWNRLQAFRITAQIARERTKQEAIEVEQMRETVKRRDQLTWCLLRVQLLMFGSGACLILAAAVWRYL